VTDHGRKYGERDSHPIPLWNGVFEHYSRIGDALWEFAWCIDRITEERDGVGLVLGGAPVKIPRIVNDLKGSRRETVRRHLDHLENENFIRRRRTAYGHVIEVLNSRKFGIWRKEKPQNDVSLQQEKPIRGEQKPTGGWQKPKINTNKEDSAVTQQEDAAGSRLPAESPLWKLVGLRPERLPAEFVRLCEGLYSAKGGQSLEEFMGVCMDSWQVLGNKIPGPFVRAAMTLRERKRLEPEATPIAFLPEVPFKPKGVQCQAQN
jgi:hypothetical protein